jgi:hypothetical protein
VTGTIQLSQEIPAKGIAPVVTTLTIGTGDAVTVAGVLASGARDYRVDVKLHFSTRVGQVDVEVTHTGRLGQGISIR